MTAMRRERPAALPPMAWYDTEVLGVRELTPAMLRVTVAGEGLRDFATAGPDEHCKLVLPRDGERLPAFDPTGNVFEQWRAMPAAIRPYLRTYTIRAVRPAAGELDLDFALHAPGGPAMRWLAGARAGSPLSIYGARGEFDPPAGTDSFLLLADPAGLPALASILETLPPGAPVRVVAETGSADEELPLPAAVRPVWAHRGAHGRPFSALLSALGRIEPPPGTPYVWAAGEAAALGDVRRHLLGRGLAPERLELVGYWRVGGVTDP